jgi:hypothetical protein
MDSRDINVVALVKGGERYVFLYGQKVRQSKPRPQRLRFGRRADRPAQG